MANYDSTITKPVLQNFLGKLLDEMVERGESTRAQGRMDALRKRTEIILGINLGPKRAITDLNPQVLDIEDVCYISEISMRQ